MARFKFGNVKPKNTSEKLKDKKLICSIPTYTELKMNTVSCNKILIRRRQELRKEG